MIITHKASEATDFIDKKRKEGLKVGFVPTMGALHEGHISLIVKARNENDLVASSIFVNPTQFNDPKDLLTYPKTPEKDHEMLKTGGCDMLFEPEAGEIYTDSYIPPVFNFGALETVMEGLFRPGHFKGVATVVFRLFHILPCQNAYFGEKDFQQLAIIREMVRQFKLPVNIHSGTTIRERDGLAMSSRNIRLTPEERLAAPVIYKTLSGARQLVEKHGFDTAKKLMVNQIDAFSGFNTEYLELVDPNTLMPVQVLGDPGSSRVCVAVKTSKTRLIDNMAV